VAARGAVVARSGDAWILDTGKARMEVRLSAGRLGLASFRNGISGREYIVPGRESPEFRFEAAGNIVTGASGGWTLAGEHLSQGQPGEWRLDLDLRRGQLQVVRHYVAYAGAGVIREWITIGNRGSVPVLVRDPFSLAVNLQPGPEANLDFSYLTGGGDFNGSQLLKTVPLGPGASRVLDSEKGVQAGQFSGFLPLAFERDRLTGDGFMVVWDYLGHWIFKAGADRESPGRGSMSLHVAGYSRMLDPGAQIEIPAASLGAFSGDVDTLGNQILDWQYGYLWDHTSDAYFARTRWETNWQGPWEGAGGVPSGDNWGFRLADDLHFSDIMRESGSEVLWDDAGWYDRCGDWRGPDWRLTTSYLAKSGMHWTLWWPTSHTSPGARLDREHPDWLAPDGIVLDHANPKATQWEFDLLTKGVKAWGGLQWRIDGALVDTTDETRQLDADRNFRELMERFHNAFPDCGIDLCSAGGRWISCGLARFADSGECTDGGVGPYSGYYASLVVPPDKMHNVADTDHVFYDASADHLNLCLDPCHSRDPGAGPDIEAVRRDWDLYRYLRSQGIVGRWGHVFRPTVEGDDPIWYFQRMDRGGTRGIVIAKHAHRAPVYFLVARRLSGGATDMFAGGPNDQCRLTVAGAARLDTGLYEDPTDGKIRYFGYPGEVYGPLNFTFRSGGLDRSFATSIPREGGWRTATDRSFGMSFQPTSGPVEVTALGLFARGTRLWTPNAINRGLYRLSLIQADAERVLAAADLDLSKGRADLLGFKYARLDRPVRLESASGPVVIHPKGLDRNAMYDVRCAVSPYRAVRNGADLMDRGVALDTVEPGELIFLNLPGHPGAGTDKTPPTAPLEATKRIGTNMGVQGVELHWTPATDDNWISYYEVLRDGAVEGRAAVGTYFFDHAGDPRERIGSRYEVRAVDGDGNRGPVVIAAETPGDPPIYRPLGGYGADPSHGPWRYEVAAGSSGFQPMRWDHSGYEGQWCGSGRARIGRIWMEAGADADTARAFIVPRQGRLSIDAPVRKDPSANNGETVGVEITLNGRRIWPLAGDATVSPDPDAILACRLDDVEAKAGDVIRFVALRTGTPDANPILWDPVITLGPDRHHG
jgi:hypothetical protein